MIKRIKRIVLIIILSILITQIHAQDSLKHKSDAVSYINKYKNTLGVSIAYRGIRNHFVEIGINSMTIGHGVIGWELSFSSNLKKSEQLSAIALGYYKSFAYFETEIMGTAYSNFDKTTFYIKPSFGLGIGGFAIINYGYNFPVTKNHFKNRISSHEIRLVFRWKFNGKVDYPINIQ